LWFNNPVKAKLDEQCLEKSNDRPVVAGVSGGADSLCLLGLLLDAGYPVIVAHLNHQLRPEAASELDHVRRIAERTGVPFVGESIAVAEIAEDEGLSIEEAARKCRYRFLFQVARQRNAQCVAVAHTADDQVETVLMHLVRGAGLSGIKGISPRTMLAEFDPQIPLVRPLLHLWRSDTETYCHEHELDFVLDSSNTDQAYFRNRLRHDLIPYLETYNPQFKKALLRTSRSLQDDHSLLMASVDDAWVRSLAEYGDGYFTFNKHRLETYPSGLLRHLFRRAFFSLRPGLRDVDFDLLELAVRFTLDEDDFRKTSATRRLDLTGGIFLYREQDLLYVAGYEADLPMGGWPQVAETIPVEIGDNELGHGWRLIIEEIDGEGLEEKSQANDDPLVAWMDASKVKDLSIRPPHPGDRIKPLGMNGQSAKVSDLFVNLKIPSRARKQWPVVFSGNEIAWVMGLRVAHPFRLDSSTRHALRLTLKRLP
jgi:tRNA(Ile)-lysidine synthase